MASHSYPESVICRKQVAPGDSYVQETAVLGRRCFQETTVTKRRWCLDGSGVQETMVLRGRWHPGDYHTPGDGGVHKLWCQGDSGVQETIASVVSC